MACGSSLVGFYLPLVMELWPPSVAIPFEDAAQQQQQPQPTCRPGVPGHVACWKDAEILIRVGAIQMEAQAAEADADGHLSCLIRQTRAWCLVPPLTHPHLQPGLPSTTLPHLRGHCPMAGVYGPPHAVHTCKRVDSCHRTKSCAMIMCAMYNCVCVCLRFICWYVWEGGGPGCQHCY